MKKIPLGEVERFAEGMHGMWWRAVLAEVVCVGFDDAGSVFHVPIEYALRRKIDAP